jgi:hypothetical protein
MSNSITISITITIPRPYEYESEIQTPEPQTPVSESPSETKPLLAPLKKKTMPKLVRDDLAPRAARELKYDFDMEEENDDCRVNEYLRASSPAPYMDQDVYRKVSLFKKLFKQMRGETLKGCQLFHDYEKWVEEELTEKEKKHLNRYQRMARFIREWYEL